MLSGLIVALVTPFLENGDLDLKSFKRLIHFQIEQGTKGLVIAGTTGEAPTLTSFEQELLIKTAVEESNGKILIFAGVGTYCTRESVEKTLRAKEMGADGCLAVFPYYNRPNFEGCLAHFKAISDCRLPLIVYYHPPRTGVHLSKEQLATICNLPSVVALKDCSGKLSFASDVMSLTLKPLFSGNDPLVLPFIASGSKGLISSLANLYPYNWNRLVKAALEGDIEKAIALYKPMESLCNVMEMESNPQGIKYAMSLAGHCSSTLRLPMVIPSKTVCKQIEEAMSYIEPLVGIR
jgi:4-hydroxy-tetrahydrodipicolinate synthase